MSVNSAAPQIRFGLGIVRGDTSSKRLLPVVATMALSAPFRRGRRSCDTMSAAFGADGDDLETVLRGQVCPSRHP
jgi:hypothetical protein